MNIYEKIELNKELVLKIERSVSTAWARKKSTDEIVDEIVKAITDRDQALQLQQTGVSRSFLSEDDLVELGFSKNLMAGTGWLTTNSMRDAVYYYKKGRITINATEFWTWFLDNEQRNDIAVSSKDALSELLQNYG